MKYWDTSALVHLVVNQKNGKEARELYRHDSSITVWRLTPVEVHSTLCRLRRNRELTDKDFDDAQRRARVLLDRVHQIDAVDEVAERARRLLGVHPLTAADALQLGAALVMVDDKAHKGHFVAIDGRLSSAARAEGFELHRLQPV